MEAELKPETLSPELKHKPKYKQPLLVALVIIVVAGFTGLATWYFMSKQVDDNKAANSAQVKNLQTKIDDLKKTNTVVTDNNTNTTQTTPLTNDQIFQEVSTQLSLTRSKISYFRIYSQDKVGYSYNFSEVSQFSGYAYKQSGKWNKVVVGMAVQDCTLYSSVPEQYRPVCTTSVNSTYSTEQIAYMNSEHGSVNYPTSSEVSYIGQ